MATRYKYLITLGLFSLLSACGSSSTTTGAPASPIPTPEESSELSQSKLIVTGTVGNAFPQIPLSWLTINDHTSASFEPAGSQYTISGEIVQKIFVPTAGQVIPSDATTGLVYGFLRFNSLSVSIQTNFTAASTSGDGSTEGGTSSGSTGESTTGGGSTGGETTGGGSTEGGSTGGETTGGGNTTGGGTTGGGSTGGSSGSTGFRVSGGQIYQGSTLIHLLGINWFGFETTNYIVHGLWSRDYKDMIAQMKSLGFNAVRLPFCPTTLQNVPTSSANTDTINTDLKGLKSLDVLDKIVATFNANQIYILLDHHRPDCNSISELWYTSTYSESQWITDLKLVATRYKSTPYFIGIDLKNEPHGSVTWGANNTQTDWNHAAERAAQAVLAVNPDILMFVEGIQEDTATGCSSSTNHWWGGNLEPQECVPLAISSDKLVLSPHVYGPDVYNQPYFNDPTFPNNMPTIWDSHFGYLANHSFAVAPGEFGGKYGHNGGDPDDITWQNSIIDYFKTKKICNFFYWTWNPNSGDTGGILQDDWINIWQDKYDNLKRLMDACRI